MKTTDFDEKNTNWRELITLAMEDHGETLADTVACTLTIADMEQRFEAHSHHSDNGGKPFTLWTTNRVYFPFCYDGWEEVKSVSRIIDNKPTPHIS